MYPTLIVVLLDKRRSIIERSIHSKHEPHLFVRDSRGRPLVGPPTDVRVFDPRNDKSLRTSPAHQWVDVSFGSPFELRSVDVAALEDDECGLKRSSVDQTGFAEKSRTSSSESATIVGSNEAGPMAI